MSEDKQYNPETEWPRTMFRTNDWISHHLIPGTWEQEYLDRVGGFVVEHGGALDKETKDVLSKVMLSDNFTKLPDRYDVFGRMHHAEALTRGLTPLEMNQLLVSQKYIASAWMPEEDLVGQRSAILEFIGFDTLEEEEARAARMFGFSLCASGVWTLVESGFIDEAQELYKKTKDQFGLRYYDAKAAHYTSQQTMSGDLSQEGKELSKIHQESSDLILEFFQKEISPSNAKRIVKTRLRKMVKYATRKLRKDISSVFAGNN